MNLLKIADKYLTDKGTNFFDKIPGAGHMYAPVYDLFLSHLRDVPISLFEIGIAKGASLCMWQEFFPNGTIVGLDITLDQVDKTRHLGLEGGGKGGQIIAEGNPEEIIKSKLSHTAKFLLEEMNVNKLPKNKKVKLTTS